VLTGVNNKHISQTKTSPSSTVSTKVLVTMLVIDAHEHRDVVTCDIVGSYSHSDMDKPATIILNGEIVNMMVEVDKEKYFKYMTYENTKKVLYIRVLKALYGCIKSGLLWHTVFTGTLEKGSL